MRLSMPSFRLLDDDRQPTSLLGWIMIGAMVLIGSSGCAPVQSAGSVAAPVVAATGDRVVVEGGRALIIANLVYQTAGTAAAIAIENEWVKGDAKAKVQAASQRAVDALEVGERAIQTADKATQAAAALSAVGDLCELHPFIKAACERAK